MSDLADFQQHMEAGHNAAWDQNWPDAIDAYTKAVSAQPDDPDAQMNLGMALLNDGQLDRALKVYRHAATLAPQDPVPLEGSADALERMGQLQEAAQQYIKVSDLYLSQRDLKRAITNWERATRLTPGLVSIHARLAQAYERIDRKDDAVREYLTLAYNFHRMDDMPKATRAIERALRIDKNHPQALNALQAIKSGGNLNLPEEYMRRDEPQQQQPSGFMDDFDDVRAEVGEAHPLGPLGEAMDEALGVLAEYVVESGLNESVMYAMQAMEYQRQDEVEQAIISYRQADESGLRHPSLRMSLGGLLFLNDRAEDAMPYLQDAATHPALVAGALHGMGQVLYAQNKHKDASRYLIQSLRAVDTSLAVSDEESSELASVYESLLTALEDQPSDNLAVINERFVALLSGADWKQRIAETRRHLDETLKGDGGQGMVDFLVTGNDELTNLVTTIDRYIRAGLYTLAMDELHRAVEKSPWYLPVHVRMAEIMMKEGRIRQAINKYNTVARSYLVREENDRAATILEEVLEMAPLDVEVRMNLIDLLEIENRHEEALEQYISLAETYQQLGDFENASDTFGAAERLARRTDATLETQVKIKHALADIHQMRLDTRAAQRIYEDILEVAPDDEKSLRALIEIYYMNGNQVEAIKRLDTLLEYLARQGNVQRIVRLLEELVQTNPGDAALRQRLALIYRRLGQKREAIEQLDALGEIQLDAGLHTEAAKTIRQIISMEPEQVDEYKRLLAQLGG